MDPSILDAFAARSLHVPMEEMLNDRRAHRVPRTRKPERRKS